MNLRSLLFRFYDAQSLLSVLDRAKIMLSRGDSGWDRLETIEFIRGVKFDFRGPAELASSLVNSDDPRVEFDECLQSKRFPKLQQVKISIMFPSPDQESDLQDRIFAMLPCLHERGILKVDIVKGHSEYPLHKARQTEGHRGLPQRFVILGLNTESNQIESFRRHTC